MEIINIKINKKKLIELSIFLGSMILSVYIIFQGQNIREINGIINKISVSCLIGAFLIAIFFVCAEGIMIYYLLKSLKGNSGLLKCISYSFIGFFYSGITPSATGGQPVQLYYMKKDGNTLADSSVVLMVVGIMYKFVLVLLGVLLLIFWTNPLMHYLKGYFYLYLLGLLLNIIIVMILIWVMMSPNTISMLLLKGQKIFNKLFKKENKNLLENGECKIVKFVKNYHASIDFFKANKKKIFGVMVITVIQRLSLFFIAYLIYYGFGLRGVGIWTIVFLQASVYIAVDMLPIPGAQGITEIMYKSVFRTIFPDIYLVSSLYVSRTISFYFLLVFSIIVIIINRLYRMKTSKTP